MISFCRVTGTRSNAGPPASVGYGVTLRLKKGTTTLPTSTSKLLRPLAVVGHTFPLRRAIMILILWWQPYCR
jgi:hypothetical protein